MRLVHLSDLHLGYRQYQRLTARGINQREADVAASFKAAIDKIVEINPDVVLLSGDIFHQVRPTNSAIVHAYLQFARLRASLPAAEIIMVAGNHDTPRSTETGSILRLFAELGLHVIDGEPRAIDLPHLDLHVLAIAHNLYPRPKLLPSGNRRWSVLLMHAPIEDEYDDRSVPAELAARAIPIEELNESAWNYIALGHYHVYGARSLNRYFSGSLDYTSTDIWGEMVEQKEKKVRGKGFIEHNLETGEHTFHALKPNRTFADLPALSARGRTTSEVNDEIASAVAGLRGGIDDKIVRLIVRDIPRHVARQLDQEMLREFRKRAMHFQLDARRPDAVMRSSGSGGPGRHASLESLVRDKLRERIIPPDVDRDALVDLGVHYLKEASDRESVAIFAPQSLLDG